MEWFLLEFWLREFSVGTISFTPLSLLLVILVSLGLFNANALLKRVLRKRILPRLNFDQGLICALTTRRGKEAKNGEC
jgi:small-conductance mechanosensitive channel|tara:strand:- start:1703 stop:1936 length:234 start_codon:yes stop_codon:yes gene_type:complete